jgi:predicted DCC family thiol-disulfide oxidoreductase YuxK
MDAPVLLFDGVCNLCNRTVQFVLTHDPAGRVRFASQQSEFGQNAIAKFKLPDLQTVVLLEGDTVFTKSDAALRLTRYLNSPWRWLEGLRVVPKPIRDALYDLVARNRYRVFGKRDACWLPRAEWRERFLDTARS